MAYNITHTYSIAKDIFNNAELKQDYIVTIGIGNAAIFRKHLSELIKRKQSGKRFASRLLLDKSMIKVIRIE